MTRFILEFFRQPGDFEERRDEVLHPIGKQLQGSLIQVLGAEGLQQNILARHRSAAGTSRC